MKLWDLFQYEHSRSGGVNPVSYHINSHAILDDNCFRMQYE